MGKCCDLYGFPESKGLGHKQATYNFTLGVLRLKTNILASIRLAAQLCHCHHEDLSQSALNKKLPQEGLDILAVAHAPQLFKVQA